MQNIRKPHFLLFAVIVLVLSLSAPSFAAPPPVLQSKVTKVIDGDTVTVSIGKKTEKVRMIGVNTPETHHPTKGVEPYGKEAAAFTTKRLTGKKIWLQKDVGERDRYGRLLAYVWLRKPLTGSQAEATKSMYNAELVANGYAQVMTIPPNVTYADLFIKLQREARENNRGLWGINPAPIKQSTQKQPVRKGNGQGPNGETIKGNINSKGEKIYHIPGGQFYDKTIPERWFKTEAEAQAAGFRRSKR